MNYAPLDRRVTVQSKAETVVLPLSRLRDKSYVVLLGEPGAGKSKSRPGAFRAPLEEALTKPGSKARNERGALAVSKFIAVGCKLWPDTIVLREDGHST